MSVILETDRVLLASFCPLRLRYKNYLLLTILYKKRHFKTKKLGRAMMFQTIDLVKDLGHSYYDWKVATSHEMTHRPEASCCGLHALQGRGRHCPPAGQTREQGRNGCSCQGLPFSLSLLLIQLVLLLKAVLGKVSHLPKAVQLVDQDSNAELQSSDIVSLVSTVIMDHFPWQNSFQSNGRGLNIAHCSVKNFFNTTF